MPNVELIETKQIKVRVFIISSDSMFANNTVHSQVGTPNQSYFEVMQLKVPKCEIFDRSDFPDFYTIKSLRVGDFGVKINNFFKNI
jgi:hypothetical protein